MACKTCLFTSTTSVNGLTIAEALDILDIYQAFKRVEQGVANFDDYDLLEGKWDLPTLWNTLLESAHLPTDLDFPVKNLSEGQKPSWP